MRSRAAADDAAAARLAALEDAFAAEVEQRAALEARVAELAAELEALDERAPQAAARRPDTAPPTAAVEQVRARARANGGASREEIERRTVEQLVAGGFAPDRAEWINRRTQELRMAGVASPVRRDARRAQRWSPVPRSAASGRCARSSAMPSTNAT